MADLDPDLAAMVANRARYQRVKTLIDAMTGRGADTSAFEATGDMTTEWLACMPPDMQKLLRLSSMMAIHKHMSRTSTIRGVLAYDPESIVEWKRMQVGAAKPRVRIIPPPRQRDED